MEIKDMLIAAGILIAALYLLYHSVWKKKGYCSAFFARLIPEPAISRCLPIP